MANNALLNQSDCSKATSNLSSFRPSHQEARSEGSRDVFVNFKEFIMDNFTLNNKGQNDMRHKGVMNFETEES